MEHNNLKNRSCSKRYYTDCLYHGKVTVLILLCFFITHLDQYFVSAFGLVPFHGDYHFLSTVQSRRQKIFTRRFLSSITTPSDLGRIQNSSQNETDSGTIILAEDEDFIKSGPDNRLYRAIRLKNGLDVLLVSDAVTDVEAGAMHIKAGHFNDPSNRAGLAHFHEHMLFLGTEKYPEENDFESFLSKNGGSSNAYTDMEDTNFYFSVASLDSNEHTEERSDDEIQPGKKISPALAGSLDRFAQFFVSPSFNVDSVERELRAIDSEYLNSITSDQWRNYQLLKQSCNPDHPFSKFGCGNYNTLTNGGNIEGTSAEESGGSSPRDVLLEFWNKYYKAGNMKLAVLGKANLDELQNQVEGAFGCIKGTEKVYGRETEREKKNVDAFGSGSNLGIIREVIPVIESRNIKILFATPQLDEALMKTSRPYQVISHLLGHESPGSLHSLLNAEGLINGLTTGVGVDTSDFSMFSISVSLTKDGMKETDRIISLIFQWIKLIKNSVESDNDMTKYHDELRRISQNRFMFRENGDPTSFVSSAAKLLFKYEPSKILYDPGVSGDYAKEVAEDFLRCFRPENALITISSPDFGDEYSISSSNISASSAQWQVEPWYKAKYRQVKLPRNMELELKSPSNIDSRLSLPGFNQFIPSNFSLRHEDSADSKTHSSSSRNQFPGPPKCLIDRTEHRMWYKMDRTFKVPKTFIRFQIISPTPYRSPRTMTLCRLYQKVLNDDLNSFVYDAAVAGCGYSVACTPNGFQVSVSGYSEKLIILLDNITSRMFGIIEEMKQGKERRPELSRKFSKACQNLLRETKNFQYDSPYEIGNYNSRILVEEPAWHVDSYISELEDSKKLPTLEECAKIAADCLQGRIRVKSLCMGNISEKEAQDVAQIIDSRFLENSSELFEDEVPVFRSRKLPSKAEAAFIFGPSSSSSSIPVVYEDMVYSQSEENHSVEILLQAGNDHQLGIEGISILELIGYIAYNSAFSQLRTKEQLGYIVSAFTRRTAGNVRGFGVVVQSSTTLPPELEKRCEAWISQFRQEIEDMSEERILMEANAVVALLLEKDTKLAEEVSRFWRDISATNEFRCEVKNPEFNRHERIAEFLIFGNGDVNGSEVITDESLRDEVKAFKQKMLRFFDKHFSATSPHRRALSSRVYGFSSRGEFEKNAANPGHLSTHLESLRLKQFLDTWPNAPYWT